MSSSAKAVPNTGSTEAVKLGCQCPVLDNAHGKGWLGSARHPKSGEPVFWISGSCELHREWEMSHD